MNIHAIEEVKDADHASRPVLAICFGRGKTGSTTFLDFIIQRARRAGRAITVADGDRKKPTLAGLYPPGEPGGALQPRGKNIGDGGRKSRVRRRRPRFRWFWIWVLETTFLSCMGRS